MKFGLKSVVRFQNYIDLFVGMRLSKRHITEMVVLLRRNKDHFLKIEHVPFKVTMLGSQRNGSNIS